MKQLVGYGKQLELFEGKTCQLSLPKETSGLDCVVGLSYVVFLTKFNLEQ